MANWISSKLKVAETFLQQIDQQAAESLGKNENPRSEELSSGNPRKSTSAVPLKEQLKKKKGIIETSDSGFNTRSKPDSNSPNVRNNRVNSAIGAGASSSSSVKPSINPPVPGLTEGDWTELLNTPSTPTSPAVNRSNGVSRVSGAQKDGRKKGNSGSNVLPLEFNMYQNNGNSSVRDLRKPDTKVIETGQRSLRPKLERDTTAAERRELDSKKMSYSPLLENTNEGNGSVSVSEAKVHDHDNKNQLTEMVSIAIEGDEGNNAESSVGETNGFNVRRMSFPATKVETPISDSGSSSETDLTSSSDSESERKKEEQKRRRALVLAERAAAKAVEAIKERENLVARLEGEKQSLEKILEERVKQQAREASELQNTTLEMMDAVELEKQKHNNTRMEALARLAKLETINADLARSLAAAQWNLEVEINRVAKVRELIESKEASHEELQRKISATRDTGNLMFASQGVEVEHEMLESECNFVNEKIQQLQEKAKKLEMNIEMIQKETEVPTEVEVELKRRLGQLTDHLIQKQTQVESLASEKATLAFRIEAVSRMLDENKSRLSEALTSNRDDLESGTCVFPNSKLRPMLEQRFESGRRHFGSVVRQLDSIFCAGAVLLRKNSTARRWSLIYLVCLHLWVVYILMSHSPVSDGSKSGAVFSLENINNTGGV